MSDEKARYSKPASQLDLERRQENGNESSARLTQPGETPLSDNGYVGVDLPYQNAANDTEKPLKVDEGAEAEVFAQFVADDAEYPVLDGEDGDDEADAEPSTTTTPFTSPTGSTPPGNNS